MKKKPTPEILADIRMMVNGYVDVLVRRCEIDLDDDEYYGGVYKAVEQVFHLFGFDVDDNTIADETDRQVDRLVFKE